MKMCQASCLVTPNDTFTDLSLGSFHRDLHLASLLHTVEFVACSLKLCSNNSINNNRFLHINNNQQTSSALLIYRLLTLLQETLDCKMILCWHSLPTKSTRRSHRNNKTQRQHFGHIIQASKSYKQHCK